MCLQSSAKNERIIEQLGAHTMPAQLSAPSSERDRVREINVILVSL
jgi:hypothetical protein